MSIVTGQELCGGGYCGYCDYVNMLSACEEAIYGGVGVGTGTYGGVYCPNCGTKVNFDNYWNHMYEDDFAFAISCDDKILDAIDRSCGYYFNEAYINSRIEIFKSVIDKACINFAKGHDNYNPYGLVLMTKLMWELTQRRDKYQGKFKQHDMGPLDSRGPKEEVQFMSIIGDILKDELERSERMYAIYKNESNVSPMFLSTMLTDIEKLNKMLKIEKRYENKND